MAAAGAAAVSVLAPNGRRVSVRVSPGTVLLQVLEEICSKQNFSPDEYDLKFQRTVLDLSLQWRFANLPNNAKLEMVPASRLRAGPGNTVRIALQLEDGSRLQEEFLSGQTLWELLQHFPQTRSRVEALSRESSPVCVYMRDEVTGEATLKRTTLKSLGLTRGSGIIRFVIKTCPAEAQPVTSDSMARSDLPGPQPATSGPSAQSDLPEPQPATSGPSAQSDLPGPQPATSGPPAQSDLPGPQPATSGPSAQSDLPGPQPAASGPSAQSDLPGPQPATSGPSAQSDLPGPQPATSGPSAQSDLPGPQPATSGPSAQSDLPEPQPATSGPSAQRHPSGPQAATSGPSALGHPLGPLPVTNGPSVQSDPSRLQPATSSPSVIKQEKDTTQVTGAAGGALPAAGSPASKSTSDSLPLPRKHQDGGPSQSQAVKAERSADATLCSKPEGRQSSLQDVGLSTSSSSSRFIPFLGGGQRLGGATGESRPSVKEAHLPGSLPTSLSSPGGPSKAKKSKTLPEQEGGFQPVDREAVVCHLDLEDPLRRDCLESCPEDLPEDFFNVTVDDVRRRLAQLKSDRQRLSEMPLMTKALREAQKKEKLERYPKVVLRVLFPDRYILQGFFHPEETVRALRDFVKSHLEEETVPFYLFLAPPRTLLNDESETFFEADLFPAAVVHFGSEAGQDHYLRQHLLDSIVSPSLADLLVARSMPRAHVTAQPLSADTAAPEEAAPRALTDHLEASAESGAPQSVKSDPGKVPKWLKLPGKKW